MEETHATKKLRDDTHKVFNKIEAAYKAARRDSERAHNSDFYRGNFDRAALDAEFQQARRQVAALLGMPEGLLLAERELLSFEAKATDIEAQLAETLTRERANAAASHNPQVTPSLTPTLNAAAPALQHRLKVLWPECGRTARDNPDKFLTELDDMEAAAKSFLSAIGVERRAAAARASERDAAAAVTAALAA